MLARKVTAVQCADHVVNIHKFEEKDEELLRLMTKVMPDPHEMYNFWNHPRVQAVDNYDADEEKGNDKNGNSHLPLEKFEYMERCWYEVRNIPSARKRCEFWLFKMEFDGLIKFEYDNINVWRKLYKNMYNNPQFKKIAELILFIGNYINYGNKRLGMTKGVGLNVFDMMKDHKGNGCQKYSLLVFLVEMVNLYYPELLHWTDMFDGVKLAKKIDSDSVDGNIRRLTDGLQEIETNLPGMAMTTGKDQTDIYIDLMNEFLVNAKKDIAKLRSDFDEALANCWKLKAHYGCQIYNDGRDILNDIWWDCIQIDKDWKKVYEIEAACTTLVFGYIRESDEELKLPYKLPEGIIYTICRHFPKWDVKEIVDDI